MAGEDQLALGSGNTALQGVSFLAGCYIAFDCMSTLNSSPWTHQTFGVDQGKADSAKSYVKESIIASLVLGSIGSALGHNPWPLVGCVVADAYLWNVYQRAYNKRGK